MIQTLGDVFVLVAIISTGVVAFLLAVFLYHLIFVVMDLRQVMRRLNELSKEIEEMFMRPVELVAGIVDWAQKMIWDAYFVEDKNAKKTKAKGDYRKGKKSKKKKKG